VAITPPSAITVAITPLPQPPQTSDPANFDARADAFVLAEQVFSQQVELGRLQMSENAASAAANAALVQDVSQNVLNAPTTMATSTSSETIGTGTKTFTGLDPSKVLGRGQFVVVSASSAPSNYMLGQVTSPQSGGSVTINVMSTGGGGTFSAWDIALQGVQLVTQRQESRRVAKTAAFTVTAADAATLFDLSGAFTVSFSSAATFGVGWYVDVVNSGVGAVVLDPNGAETIGGATAKTLRPGESGRIYYASSTGLSFLQFSEAIGIRVRSDAPPGDNWLPRDGSALSQSAYPALYSIVGRKFTVFDNHVSGTSVIGYGSPSGGYIRYEKLKGRYFSISSQYGSSSVYIYMFGVSFSLNPAQVGSTYIDSGFYSRPAIISISSSTNVAAFSVGTTAVVIRDISSVSIPKFSQSGLSNLGRRSAFGSGNLYFRNGQDLWSAVDLTTTTAFSQVANVLPVSDANMGEPIGILYHAAMGVFFTANVSTKNAWKSSTPSTASSWVAGAFSLPTYVRDLAMLSDGSTVVMVGANNTVWISTDLASWSQIGVLYGSKAWRIWPQSNGLFAITDEGGYVSQDTLVYIGDKNGLSIGDFDYLNAGAIRPMTSSTYDNGYGVYPDLRSPYWDDAASAWVVGGYEQANNRYVSSWITTTECNLATQFTLGRPRVYLPGAQQEYVKAL